MAHNSDFPVDGNLALAAKDKSTASCLFSLQALKRIVLTLEWEISQDNLADLQRELKSLEEHCREDRILTGFLRILKALGLYITGAGAKTHPAAVKLFFAVYRSLEKIADRPRLKIAQKKKGLLLAYQKYNQLRKFLDKQALVEETHCKTEKGLGNGDKTVKNTRTAGEAASKNDDMAVGSQQVNPAVVPALAHLDAEGEMGSWLAYDPIDELEERLDTFFEEESAERSSKRADVVPMPTKEPVPGEKRDNASRESVQQASSNVIADLFEPEPETAADAALSDMHLSMFNKSVATHGEGKKTPDNLETKTFAGEVAHRLDDFFPEGEADALECVPADAKPSAVQTLDNEGGFSQQEDGIPEVVGLAGHSPEDDGDKLASATIALVEGVGENPIERVNGCIENLEQRFAENTCIAAHLAMLRVMLKGRDANDTLTQQKDLGPLMVDTALQVGALLKTEEKADGAEVCALVLRFMTTYNR